MTKMTNKNPSGVCVGLIDCGRDFVCYSKMMTMSSKMRTIPICVCGYATSDAPSLGVYNKKMRKCSTNTICVQICACFLNFVCSRKMTKTTKRKKNWMKMKKKNDDFCA